jgi:hypothetical protein
VKLVAIGLDLERFSPNGPALIGELNVFVMPTLVFSRRMGILARRHPVGQECPTYIRGLGPSLSYHGPLQNRELTTLWHPFFPDESMASILPRFKVAGEERSICHANRTQP